MKRPHMIIAPLPNTPFGRGMTKELAAEQRPTTEAELKKKTMRVPLDLVCPAGVAHEAQAMRDGFIKYWYASYLNDGVEMTARHCLAAAKRHIERLLACEDKAPEPNGAHHAGHARAMLGIYLECMEAGVLVDDRHPRHKANPYIGKMFDRMAKENASG